MGDRMETVLRLRQLREWERRVELGRASRRVEAARAALAAAESARAAGDAAVRDAVTLRRARVTAVGLQHRVEEAAAELTRRRTEREQAVAAWQEARAEERAAERLVERRREAVELERRRDEQRELDEIALLVTGGAQ